MERIQMTRCPNCGSRAIRREGNKASRQGHVNPSNVAATVECRNCNYLERFLGSLPTAQLSNEEFTSPSEPDIQYQLEKDSFYRLLYDWERCNGIFPETLFVGGSTVRIPLFPSQ